MEIVTKQDFMVFKNEVLSLLTKLLQPRHTENFIKAKQAAVLLQCSPNTLRNYRINGTLRGKKTNGVWYYPQSELDKLMGG